MKALTAWEWPGNIRALENFVERAVILSRGRSRLAPLGELRKMSSVEPKATANHDEIARIVKETINALRGNNGITDERFKEQGTRLSARSGRRRGEWAGERSCGALAYEPDNPSGSDEEIEDRSPRLPLISALALTVNESLTVPTLSYLTPFSP